MGSAGLAKTQIAPSASLRATAVGRLSDREIDEGAFELGLRRHFRKRVALHDLDIVETAAFETTLGFDGERAEALDRDHRAREMRR